MYVQKEGGIVKGSLAEKRKGFGVNLVDQQMLNAVIVTRV
jgi:hypothetical protein